jgi:hypothetical protein
VTAFSKTELDFVLNASCERAQEMNHLCAKATPTPELEDEFLGKTMT